MPLLKHLSKVQAFVTPTNCCVCGQALQGSEQTFCASCTTRLLRSIHRDDSQSATARIFWGTTTIVRVGVLWVYQSGSPIAQVLRGIKYRHQEATCIHLGCMLATFYQERHFFEGIDLIVPVPLSRQRQLWRGYNQSEKIAVGIAQVTHIPLSTQCVSRIKDNPTQTHLTPTQRQKNVEGIFEVTQPQLLQRRHVLLIDDIITTGATLGELLRTLSAQAPSCRFSILALGRGEDVWDD